MNKDKPTLYLIRGLPGSGKSTLARQLSAAELVEDYFEADQWFDQYNNGVFDASKLNIAHLYCKSNVIDLLYDGYSVAVSNTSTTEKEVEVYREIAEDNEANFVSIVVENRNNTKNIHNVPDETLQKMRNRFSFRL